MQRYNLLWQWVIVSCIVIIITVMLPQQTPRVQAQEPSPVTGTLVASTRYVRSKTPIMFLASFSALPINPVVHIANTDYPLVDDGTAGDIQANDTIYTAMVTISNKGLYTAELRDNGTPLHTTTFKVLPADFSPNLLVVTDWRVLYGELVDTGMNAGTDLHTVDNDLQAQTNAHIAQTNGRHDFIDLVEHVQRYATDYQGMVVDITTVVTTGNGFPKTTAIRQSGCLGDYVVHSYYAGTKDRFCKAALIDEMIATYTSQSCRASDNSTHYVVLIGDDEVVPAFRLRNPIDVYDSSLNLEKDYLKPEAGSSKPMPNHPVTDDVWGGYIMTDVPYAIRKPQNMHWGWNWTTALDTTDKCVEDINYDKPLPDMAIGRVFGIRPYELIQAIDRFRAPLDMSKETGKAHIFIGNDIPVATSWLSGMFQMVARSQIVPVSRWFSLQSQRLVVHDAARHAWQSEVPSAIASDTLVSTSGTADHLRMYVTEHDLFEASDMSESTTHRSGLYAALGGHMGLVLSDNGNNTTGVASIFAESFALQLARKGITLIAPTGFAYTYNHTIFAVPSVHERILSFVIDHALDDSVPTVGDVWKEALQLYVADYPSLKPSGKGVECDPATHKNDNLQSDYFHTAAAYGIGLIGLPTQPLRAPHASLCGGTPQPVQIISTRSDTTAAASLAASAPATSYQLPVDVTITQQPLPDGTTLFRAAGGSLTSPPFGETVPILLNRMPLPAGMQTDDVHVTLAHSTTHQLPGTYRLPRTQVKVIGGQVLTGTYTAPPYYPEHVFDYHVVETNNGKGSELLLSVVPLRYHAASGSVTLYDDLVFDVAVNNNGATLATTTGYIPYSDIKLVGNNIQITLPPSREISGTAVLAWTHNDGAGKVLSTQRALIDIPTNTLTMVFTPTPDINPRDNSFLEVHVMPCELPPQPGGELKDWGGVGLIKDDADIAIVDLIAELIVDYPDPDVKVDCPGIEKRDVAQKDWLRYYFPGEIAEWHLCIKGSKEDLSNNFIATVDGMKKDVTTTVTKVQTNTVYHVALPFNGLEYGVHIVQIDVQNGTQRDSKSWAIRYYDTGIRMEPAAVVQATHDISSTRVFKHQEPFTVFIRGTTGQGVPGIPARAFSVLVNNIIHNEFTVVESDTNPGEYTVWVTVGEEQIGTSSVHIQVVHTANDVTFATGYDTTINVQTIGRCRDGKCPPLVPTCQNSVNRDTVARASYLAPLNEYCQAVPSSSTDTDDWYKIQVPPDQNFFVYLAYMPEGITYTLKLYRDPRGEVASNLNADGTKSSAIGYRDGSSGTAPVTYYVRVEYAPKAPDNAHGFDVYHLMVQTKFKVFMPLVQRVR